MNQTPALASSPDYLGALLRGEFDFLDFGCSAGGSIEMAKKLFVAERGLGIDINAKKIEMAQTQGHAAMLYDIVDLPGKPYVRFCVMSHFLEHVGSHKDVVTFIRKACAVSREFVYIQQPYFDADGYLFQRGLKLFWSDWHGHPNCMTTLMFYTILAPLRARGEIGDFSIHVRRPIKSSNDTAVHSIRSPRDQHHYDSTIHPPKRTDQHFDFPVFRETVVWITKTGVPHEAPFSQVHTDRNLYSSVGEG